MTQEELAEKLDVSRQAVSKWEADLSVPAQGNLQELCKILGVTLPVEAVETEPVRVKRMPVIWKILCMTGWALACIMGLLLLTEMARHGADETENVLSDVSFYDSNGNRIECEANWYTLDASTTVVITYEGRTPDVVTLYLTPSGTETLSEREQLAVLPGEDDQKGYILVHLTFSESVMGHLQVALDYGNTSILSEEYNVFLA